MSEELARELRRMGVCDDRILAAMAATPRRSFVPEPLASRADGDYPLPIGFGQTISQPFMVAWMTELLQLVGTERVLEVGTGSGYQAAILGRLCERVYTVELVPALAERARATLAQLGIGNVSFRLGDGALGWPEEAPFDRVIVTAAAIRTPPALVAQLRPGGRMVIPIGAEHDVQYVHLLTKDGAGALTDRELLAVRFVPLRSADDGVGLGLGE